MAQLSHQQSDNVKVTCAASCGGSAWVEKHLEYFAGVFDFTTYSRAVLNRALGSWQRGKGNPDNLAGNRAEAKEAVCERRDEQRHWEGTQLALNSWAKSQACVKGMAAQRGGHLHPCWSLCLWASLKFVVELMDTTSCSVGAAQEEVSLVAGIVGDCVVVKPWSRVWRNPLIFKSLS